MTMTRKNVYVFLATVLLIGTAFSASAFYMTNNSKAHEMSVDYEVYQGAEHTLKGFLGMRDDSNSECDHLSTCDDSVSEVARLTQRVTIVGDNGVLPISGTVTKAQDNFYPDTYELKFSNKAILNGSATVNVSLDVREGELVYVLLGNKESGYQEYQRITVEEKDVVSFETRTLQDFTISKTDIIGAQKAMASVLTH